MNKEELRLKCLEIGMSKTPDPREAMARADMFLEYVCRSEPKQESKPTDGDKISSGKKSENSRILP